MEEPSTVLPVIFNSPVDHCFVEPADVDPLRVKRLPFRGDGAAAVVDFQLFLDFLYECTGFIGLALSRLVDIGRAYPFPAVCSYSFDAAK